MKLPTPEPPDEKLTKALEEFYLTAEELDRPRNA
jgi:hypothetical protein